MPRLLVLLIFLLVAGPADAAGPRDGQRPTDYGDALFYAYQGRWFDAIALLDAKQARPGGSTKDALAGRPLQVAGFFELNYRMHQQAGRAMTTVIEGAVQDAVRNEALFHLARMYFQKDQQEDALAAVERIRGSVPDAIRADLAFLRANIYLANGRNAEAAGVLKGLQGVDGLEGFSSYNLAVALMRSGDEQQGREFLDRTGRIESVDRAVLAIRDKANLILGEKLLADGQLEPGKEMLDRVRLSGPFSNRALLSSGWGCALQEQFKIALVPWTALAEREPTDPAVQEVLLAVPYAYGRLGAYGTAALRYEAALDTFGREIARIDAAVAGIRDGRFLKGLLRQELMHDADWVVRLREQPDEAETLSLIDLMASNDFQESLKNYLDLAELRDKLDTWTSDLSAFEDLIGLRWAHYRTLLPAIDRETAEVDAAVQARREQRDAISRRLDAMQTDPHPELLITAEEHRLDEEVARLEKLWNPRSEMSVPAFYKRVKRLRAILTWNMYASYDARYESARTHLRELDGQLAALDRQRRSFARVRLTAIEGYQGYVDQLRRLRQGIDAGRERVRDLMERQGRVIETMAVDELAARRERLEEFRVKARFALADSYDRANKARLQKKGAP